jgi:pimeloyl-ACP methyl ester carboxylesterase
VAGHSLGGGVGLQFAYQFPERIDRLVLVSSGGFGQQLTPMLRAATLPGADIALAGLAHVPLGLTRRILPAISVLPGIVAREDTEAVADALHGLAGFRQRRAFVRTARTVINWQGQTVNGSQHLKLLEDLPVLLAWGSKDRTIPPHHQQRIAGQLPGLHTAEIVGAGHYPQETTPELLLPPMQAFLASTQPFRYAETRWRGRLGATHP